MESKGTDGDKYLFGIWQREGHSVQALSEYDSEIPS